METTLLIKLKKDVKKEASEIASQIGVPLSTLISAFLRNFIQEKKITLSVEPEVSKAKIRKWEKMAAYYRKNPEKGKQFNSMDELFKYLKL